MFYTRNLPTIADTLSRAIKNQLTSPFLKLPGEIRNKIYEYTFINIQIHIHSLSSYSYNRSTALISACSQLRFEARTMFFARAIYHIFERAWDDMRLFRDIAKLAVCQLITSIRIPRWGANDLEGTTILSFPALVRVYVSGIWPLDDVDGIREKLRVWTENANLEVVFEAHPESVRRALEGESAACTS